jgi:prepilin-type processing-associated H-X9-DG protein
MTMPSPVNCPHCGQPYAMGPEHMGQTFQCTKCGRPFVAGAMPAPMQYASGAYAQQRSNGMAIASLVCGLLLCVPFANILAIIFGILGLLKTKDPRVGGKGLAIAGIVLGGITLLMIPLEIAILLPSLNRARETANRVKCASEMRQVGQAILLYANANNGQYPPDLGTLITTQGLSPTSLVCPSSNDTPSPGPDAATQAANLNTGGHCSFIYIGKGLTQSADPATPVLYEPLTDHANGTNVLFVDGHVEFQNRSQLNNGVPRSPPGH